MAGWLFKNLDAQSTVDLSYRVRPKSVRRPPEDRSDSNLSDLFSLPMPNAGSQCLSPWSCVESDTSLRCEFMDYVDELLKHKELIIVLADSRTNQDYIEGCFL